MTFWRKDNPPLLEKKEFVVKLINQNLTELTKQLHLSDEANLINKINDHTKNILNDKIKASIDSKNSMHPLHSSIEGEIASSSENFISNEAQEEFKRSKKDYLLRKILDFQLIFKEIYQLTGKDCFLFLDDLYHILRKDQASLIDYFHRVSKGNKV